MASIIRGSIIGEPRVVSGVESVNGLSGTVVLDLDSLVDVDTTGVLDGYVLTYNTSTSTWVAEPGGSAIVSASSVIVNDSAFSVLTGTNAQTVFDDIDDLFLGAGDVDGPTSATDNAVAVYNGTSGKIIKNTTVTIDSLGNIIATSATLSAGLGTSNIRALGSGGLLVRSNSGTSVALYGAGGGAGATYYGGVNIAGTLHLTAGYSVIQMDSGGGTNTVSLYGPLTPTDDQAYYLPDRSGELATMFTPIADTLAAVDSAFNVTSLNTSTYPSLTEIAYIKGVTSSVQSQINALPIKTQTQGVGSNLPGALANQDYTVGLKVPFAGTITETTTKCASGTATATFKIDGVALGGTANSVSTSEQSQAHTSANTFVAGNDIIITISSNASCTDMSYMIKYTRTLD